MADEPLHTSSTGLKTPLPVLPAVPQTLPVGGERQISPTDVSQFIRLEQCERYLRLRLHERSANRAFMRDYGVAPQAITPLLTRSGAAFESAVEGAVAEQFETVDFARDRVDDREDAHDNARLLAEVRALPPGATRVVFQPRLEVHLAGWRIRGDVDVLRLERDDAGALRALIVDMKSSTSSRIEHRLQVAFYHQMLHRLLADAGLACAEIGIGILYRGQAAAGANLSPEEAARLAAQRDDAARLFGVGDALLDRIADPAPYLDSVADLVTGAGSTAHRVAAADFAAIPYHLTYKCDGCLYNEFCMKWSAEHDDLSLLPHLSEQDKGALRRAGVATTRELAALKTFRDDTPDLVAAPGQAELVRALSATWPVGPRLDELVHRARRYRKWKKDPIEALGYIPSKGYGSLPYADAGHNPNLVRVYVDAQHDYLQDRIYLLGALVVACEGGVEARRRSVVHLADGPPDSAEREEALFVRWIAETLRAVVELAGDDEAGERRAPIHLIFYNAFEQRLLLDGLARHFGTILGATPFFDFLTQLASYDSPVATFLDQEIRELKNYPMVCQSLQAVAAYLRFDWNEATPYRELFRARLFDFWGKLDERGAQSAERGTGDGLVPDDANPSSLVPSSEFRAPSWYTNRARFNSQVPLEYAYAAWGELPAPANGEPDDYADYRAATPELLRGFQARRLEALEWITGDFPGNKQTEKRAFDLPDLDRFKEQARTLAHALDEFVTIERHVDINAWKAARLAPPERRALAGDTLLARYLEEDQPAETVVVNRANQDKLRLREHYEALYLARNPGAERAELTREQKKEVKADYAGLRFRLRLAADGLDCNLDELLALSTMREGDRLVLRSRTTVDSRLPEHERAEFTPTPRQLLYGMRVDLERIEVERDERGRALRAWAEVVVGEPRFSKAARGFVFAGWQEPLVPGRLYTLDPDPNDWYGHFQKEVAQGLCAGERNTLYDRIVNPAGAHVTWLPAAAEGQARFLRGLDALREAGALHDFEPSKREFIGARGDAPTLLVQGPPGTGKSYSTAFALFARLQGAMAADQSYRAFLSCKTHAATDVLLANVVEVQRKLREWAERHPELFDCYFDRRLLDLPLYRALPKEVPPAGVTVLLRDSGAAERIMGDRWCVVGATPAGIRGLIKERWSKSLFGHTFCDCLVLDEASQMNLPEAAMAALPLKPDGHLVVVGDHRQMPPIVKHDWGNERRRTFQEYRSYESLFQTLLPLGLPMIKFAESFRLHADMAEFLRREIYHLDGIAYHSNRRDTLAPTGHADPFVASVLAPEQTIVVVVHDEAESQQRNRFEQELITPVLEALADERGLGLGPEKGLGVVVPHRAQRAALLAAVPALAIRDPVTGAIRRQAVDTVERFQGDERVAIVVSATESDRQYLLAASEFLLDPRRLTVALSRAKRKMVLVASRSVFSLFSADEETFGHAQLWKNLLRRTCTTALWSGERPGERGPVRVEVWGNGPAPARVTAP